MFDSQYNFAMSKKAKLSFDDYQLKSRKTAIYPDIGNNIVYPTLGLTGEAGEVAEKVKKILRDKKGIVGRKDKKELIKELGDVLWYLSNIASELNISLGEVARWNLKKLSSRLKRGKLHGEGDNR